MVKVLRNSFFYCLSLILLSLSATAARADMQVTDSVRSFSSIIESVPIVKCYPNPATSYIIFTFERAVPANSRLIIYSFTGRKMTETPISNDRIQVQLDSYFRGLYLYQVVQKNGEIIDNGKFQVLK